MNSTLVLRLGERTGPQPAVPASTLGYPGSQRPACAPPRPKLPTPAALCPSLAAKAAPASLDGRRRGRQVCAGPTRHSVPHVKAAMGRTAGPGPAGPPRHPAPPCCPAPAATQDSSTEEEQRSSPGALTLLQGLQSGAIAHQILLIAVAGLRRRHFAAAVAGVGQRMKEAERPGLRRGGPSPGALVRPSEPASAPRRAVEPRPGLGSPTLLPAGPSAVAGNPEEPPGAPPARRTP